jgi:HD-like signal output (HDOD) protein
MKLAAIDREIEAAERDGLVRDIAIPPCPELLTALLTEARKAEPDLSEIVRIASSDVAMGAALIRVANSPLYSRPSPAHSVADAITLLGQGQAVAILTGFMVRKAIPAVSPLMAHFWETSTRRSLAMAYIARQLYDMDADVAQTCGLFMHVGIPILLQGLPGYAETLTKALARQDRSFTATENILHRTDHAVIGAIVARTWNLTPEIAIAVRLHHDFAALQDAAIPARVRGLVAIAAIAEYLVAKFENVAQQPEWLRFGPACLAYLQVGEGEVETWVDALHPVFEGVVLA